MSDLDPVVRASRGVVSRQQLADLDVGDPEIRRLVRRGTIRRLRPGWFAAPHADPMVVEAVSAGGILTCVSALRRHGLWVPEHEKKLHMRPAHRKVRLASGCRVHGSIPPPTAAVDDLLCSLAYAARSLDAEGLVVVCDSALNSRHATIKEITSALAPAPARTRALVDRCDGGAQSGTETMVRLRLRSRNISVTPQPRIAGVGFVDLLVGDRLVVECDSREYHTGIERYENDRARDRTLIELGYLPLRLSYRQIVHDWSATEAAILTLVRRGDHRR
ncbi:type IV toxin-antitoxin system AbiEi family antitoxin domain-containing protein [Williamsia herbipolensis]|uniref:type IV toxin-antitoxin system AbiEi family antitoxin domain-containing protein n=1 Tax=Williamsia herbipolensis TaxID=1603258 RepID=UPI0005F86C39|nr:type IV toxin-antitoxin system AbiEi family antitoxin domain-containing protein [Williamsia herbipolensis]